MSCLLQSFRELYTLHHTVNQFKNCLLKCFSMDWCWILFIVVGVSQTKLRPLLLVFWHCAIGVPFNIKRSPLQNLCVFMVTHSVVIGCSYSHLPQPVVPILFGMCWRLAWIALFFLRVAKSRLLWWWLLRVTNLSCCMPNSLWMKVPKKCNTINQIHSEVPLFTTSFSYESKVGPTHLLVMVKRRIYSTSLFQISVWKTW